MSDLRYALRSLSRSPVFTVVAILSLALGAGANTAIFSLIDSVMLKMLPIDHPERALLRQHQTCRSRRRPHLHQHLQRRGKTDAAGRAGNRHRPL